MLSTANQVLKSIVIILIFYFGGFETGFCSSISAVWVNDGHDKVTKDELRSFKGQNTINSIWNGEKISLFAARNEVVSFNVIIECATSRAENITIEISHLTNENGSIISSKKVNKENLFNYVGRNIEIFYVQYLPIIGLSRLAYEPTYDERHVPVKLQLPYSLPKGHSKGRFSDRPNANKFYPDIAVPMEAVGNFDIGKGENHSVWVDIYIPQTTKPGFYEGEVLIKEAGVVSYSIPINLEILSFALPDHFNAKTMVWINEADINERYTGVRYDDSMAATPDKKKIMDLVWFRHHLMAKRHRISLITDGIELFRKQGFSRWRKIFNGDLFSQGSGYSGPGEGIAGDIYSVGTYGMWRALKGWDAESKKSMWVNTDKIVSYFNENFPDVEYFLYLLDEPKKKDFEKVEQWAAWIKENPGPGNQMKTLCTTSLVNKQKYMPSVDLSFMMWGDTEVWEKAVNYFRLKNQEVYAYNGWRPSTGTFMTEDDGIALRVNGWIQFKHKIARWFYWASTNYRNPSRVKYETNVFKEAQTFGRKSDAIHKKYGETGNNYGNGDGLLFYPGIDVKYIDESLDILGPIASLRLKMWRRGLQDYEYLRLASEKNPESVRKIVERMVPKSLWELGVSDKSDPTYVHAGISWSTDPDDWERARRELSDIILNSLNK